MIVSVDWEEPRQLYLYFYFTPIYDKVSQVVFSTQIPE